MSRHRHSTVTGYQFPSVQVRRADRRRQAELRLQLGSVWVDTGLVFTKVDGSALVPDSTSQ
jgi:hypothetical protein